MKRLGLVVTIVALVIAAAIGLVVTMGAIHDKSVASDVGAFSEPVPVGDYYLEVLVKIVALDLNKETVGLQLECIPKGDALVDDGGHLKRALVLTLGVSAAGTEQKKTIPSGDTGAITTAYLDLDGNVEEYPGDRHTTSLWLSATRQAQGLDPDPIPIRLQTYGAWPGLDIDSTASDWAPDWHSGWNPMRQLDIAVTRSHATTMVVYFSVALTWILIASVVGMTLAVVFGGRKTEIAMVAFFTTLLFALTAFRNALPGAPPMGTSSDYLAFFWGYAAAIVAIGVLSAVWLWRRPPKDEHKSG
ncbi:MAG: DUF4436 family protein [Actinomycetes bacterium]